MSYKDLKAESLKIQTSGTLNGKDLCTTFEIFFDKPVSYFSKEVKEAQQDLLKLMASVNNVNIE